LTDTSRTAAVKRVACRHCRYRRGTQWDAVDQWTRPAAVASASTTSLHLRPMLQPTLHLLVLTSALLSWGLSCVSIIWVVPDFHHPASYCGRQRRSDSFKIAEAAFFVTGFSRLCCPSNGQRVSKFKTLKASEILYRIL